MDLDRKFAILIDAENIPCSCMGKIMGHVGQYGCRHALIRRAYADWSKPNLACWKPKLLKYGFKPVHQPSYVSGKNSSDLAMTIDVMDILFKGVVDTFFLVTSDSDFTPLALRLREAGKNVIGMGVSSTLKAFSSACHGFVCLDVSEGVKTAQKPKNGEEKGDVMQISKKNLPTEVKDIVTKAVLAEAKKDGWTEYTSIASYLNRKGFDFKKYGFNKFKNLLVACDSFLLIEGKRGKRKVRVKP